MGTIPNIILQNSYRTLGVYANSPKKDIVANKGKAVAFVKVGKEIEFPLDLIFLLPSPSRSLNDINEAEGHLSIAKEKVRYAQFWFLKMTPLDDVAFNNLIVGDISKAKEIWAKKDTLSSLQNKLVCHLIDGKPWLAIKVASKLYHDFGAEYLTVVDPNTTMQMTNAELLHQFLNTMISEFDVQKLLGYELEPSIKEYISKKAIEPLVQKISSEVEKAKKVDHGNPKARLEGARRLVATTRDIYSQLKKMLPSTDPQFQMISDKLGLEILQCGIDYFNKSSDEDKHLTAMKMQKYASSIVVGSLAKQRCDENVRILQKMINELPPESIKEYDSFINIQIASCLLDIQNTRLSQEKLAKLLILLEKCAPHITSIKDELSASHSYYLKVSTQLVNVVLSNVIDIVNTEISNFSELADYRKRYEISFVKDVVGRAWALTLIMEKFDLEPSFKAERFMPNRNILLGILDQIGVRWQVVEIDMRSERKLLYSCKTVEDCDHYLKTFPKGKHRIHIEAKKQAIRFNTCKTLRDCDILEKDYPEKKTEIDALREKITYENCNTIANCKVYLGKYPNGKYKTQVEDRIDKLFKYELDNCETIDQYEIFIESYSDCKYVGDAQERMDALIRSRKRKNVAKCVLWSLVALTIVVLLGYLYCDSKRRREIAEQQAKQAEYNLYDKIVNKGDTLLCSRYLDSYPNGVYTSSV